jgi:hypothetical protein
MATMALKGRGGSALTVMRYSIPPRYARANNATRSLVIVGGAVHDRRLNETNHVDRGSINPSARTLWLC